MTEQRPEQLEVCPKCKTPTLEAPGIGPFCPNKGCDVRDNILQVERSPLREALTAKTVDYDRVAARAIRFVRAPLALTAVCLLCGKETESMSLKRMDPPPRHKEGCPLLEETT